MSVIESLKRRARFLAAGFLSFLVVLAAIRWSSGEPLLQPAGDLGLIIGFIFVAAFFVIADTYRGPSGGAP
jgi:Na+-translocating ferredoxin:NAD+ oxidoreductase RnfD subunit